MITPYSLAKRFDGVKEIAGAIDNPMIMAMLKLDNTWPTGDEVPWCSAFVNYIAWLAELPRTKSLLARSWLGIGTRLQITQAVQGSDIVVLKRGTGDQPGPEDRTAPGHVGFFSFAHDGKVWILGGNQSDKVCVQPYSASLVLGVRRLE